MTATANGLCCLRVFFQVPVQLSTQPSPWSTKKLEADALLRIRNFLIYAFHFSVCFIKELMNLGFDRSPGIM